MRTRKFLNLLIVIHIAVSNLFAQDDKVIQFSGIVQNEQGETLPFVHVFAQKMKNGTVTDQDGLFSFVVKDNDTIWLSSIGFKTDTFIISDTMRQFILFESITLEQDTIEIQALDIYPWKSYAEFKRMFEQLQVEDKDMEHARKNLENIYKELYNEDVIYSDPQLSFKYAMDQHYEKKFIQGQYPSIKILDPIAWSKFFQALRNGMFTEDD